MSAQAVRLTEGDIDDALSGEALEVVFQPVFSFEDGAPFRVEAFVRWAHPVLGTLPPGAFVSFFEAQGRMGDLTRYVLRRSIAAYKAWRGVQGPGLSVNLAASDVADDNFPDALTGILAAERVPPSLVMLECPPLTAQGATASWDRYRALSSTGCPLAVEVRGRASEALWAADPFPFAEIKTGGPSVLRFARTARGGPGLAAISELIELARKRNARCVAVGIEDATSADALRALGFDGGQGNLLSPAAPLDGFGAESINKVRDGLGLPALDRVGLSALFERRTMQSPLVLTDAADEGPRQDHHFDGSMAEAIARLKAKKIAAKKDALGRAEEERQRMQSEAAAARQASDTAKRLQERLEAELGVPVPASGEAVGRNAAQRPEAAPEPGAFEPEDEEAGLLLSDNLAELALGVVRRASFADGISLDGYRSDRGGAAQGAVSDDALPLEEDDAEVADAICRILDALPNGSENAAESQAEESRQPLSHLAEAARRAQKRAQAQSEAKRFDDNKARIRGQAAKALPAPASAPALAAPKPIIEPVWDGETLAMQPGIFALDIALETELTPEDLLDRAVAAVPEIHEDQSEAAFTATGGKEAALAARIRAPRRRRPANLLTRKYRITHFWPRSWVRAARRYKTVRAQAEMGMERRADEI